MTVGGVRSARKPRWTNPALIELIPRKMGPFLVFLLSVRVLRMLNVQKLISLSSTLDREEVPELRLDRVNTSTFPTVLIKWTPPRRSELLERNTTLVILMGSIRSTEQAWLTLYRHVLDLNRADLALLVPKTAAELRTASLYSRAKYVWEFHDFGEYWDDAINMMGSSRDTNLTWRKYARKTKIAFGATLPLRKKGILPGSGAIIFSLRWFLSMRLEPLLPLYERYVITRTDHLYFCPHPLNRLNGSYIWVPEGADDFTGINDRHVVCDRDDVLSVLNILPPIVRHPSQYIGHDPGFKVRNTETLLKMRWMKDGLWERVRRYPRTMAITATPTDETRWIRAKNPAPHGPALGLLIKYWDEYILLNATCRPEEGPSG